MTTEKTESRKRRMQYRDVNADGTPKDAPAVVDVKAIGKPSKGTAADFTAELKKAVGQVEPDAAAAAATELLVASKPPPAARISQVALGMLKESPTNPRRTFGGMEALTESIKRMGLLHALLVRPIWKAGEKPIGVPEYYEIVAGHRRFRAAKAAGLESVPCDVRELSDSQVIEAQITENLQRSDLNPIEEAEAYEALHTRHGYTVEQIAEKIARSRGTVYGRMKLLALCPEARTALYEGTLPQSVGVPLARLPSHALQAKALKVMKDRMLYDGTLNARQAIDFLQREYTITLKGAPFSLKDDLLTEAGACTTCPKRAKNGTPGIFDDLKAAGDVCTDVTCYRAKCSAAWEAKAKAAEAEGAKVLDLNEGAKLFPYGDGLPYGSAFVELDTPNHEDPKKRTWRELLDKLPEDAQPRLTLAPDRAMKPHELVDRKAAVAAIAEHLEAKWAKSEISQAKRSKAAKAEVREDRAEREALEAVANEGIERVVEQIGKTGPNDLELRALLLMLSEYGNYEATEKLEEAEGADLDKLAAKASGKALYRLIFAIALPSSDTLTDCYAGAYSAELKAICKARGVDLGEIARARKAAAERDAEKAKAEALFKKTGAKKGGAK